MTYRFRLTFYHPKPGFFRCDEQFVKFHINDDIEVGIYPRDSDKLITATKYHAECGGFVNELEARACGEKLRKHLKILNCLLNLGICIPSSDATSGSVNDNIKSKAIGMGGKIYDTFIGLHILPDDENHLEFVLSGKGTVYPSDPLYVLKAVKDIWQNEYILDERSKTAFEILNLSVQETSNKIRFLTTYLAIEQLIVTSPRCEEAQTMIDNYIKIANDSNLENNDKKSLISALQNLKEQSFSSAFSTFAKKLSNPKTINGKKVSKFVSECISLRNKIAHVSNDKMGDLETYTKSLREMGLGIIWSFNKLPDIAVYRPADTISLNKMEIKLL